MPQTGRHCPMLRITGHVAVVRLLLELKADVNTKDGHEKTALFWAAQNGHKADVDAKSYKGTALFGAAQNRHEAVVKSIPPEVRDAALRPGRHPPAPNRKRWGV
jgi:hypothetical protein